MLGREAAARIVREYDAHYAPSKRIIPVEDAFVGVLAQSQDISARDLLTFQEPPRGSLQTREMFIDQVLVHRVVEPYKAFRWLMLSSNCHAGPWACALARNRTRGLSHQGVLPTSPDVVTSGGPGESERMPYDRDWLSASIPRASADARTGSRASYDRPAGGSSTAQAGDVHHKRLERARRRKERRRRSKKRGG